MHREIEKKKKEKKDKSLLAPERGKKMRQNVREAVLDPDGFPVSSSLLF